MALPKLETPVYTLNLPSTDEEIKYRPFLVKEQKRIMMAQESESVTEIIDTINQLISDCTFKKLDANKIAMFDAEYIFLQVRSKSVGSKVELTITCPDDEKTKVSHTVNLDEINVAIFDDHTNEIQLTEDIKVFGDMLSNGSLTPEALKGMAELYDHKFNELYQYFEASVK